MHFFAQKHPSLQHTPIPPPPPHAHTDYECLLANEELFPYPNITITNKQYFSQNTAVTSLLDVLSRHLLCLLVSMRKGKYVQ